MRVFGRALILGACVAVFTPWAASAAPIALTDITVAGGDPCTAVGVTTANCGLFALDPSTARQITGSFGSTADLFLFEFMFAEETQLTVTTSSYLPGNPEETNFDPTLGLFLRTGPILNVPDPLNEGELGPARQFDIDISGDPPNYNDHINVTLAPGVEYVMALAVGNLRESLLAGYDCEFGCDFGGGNLFAFTVSAVPSDGGPAPVPEPGTLTLMAGGAIAGLLQRRRARKRQAHSSSVSR